MGRKRKLPVGNNNELKSSRRIELGWFNFNQISGIHQQVRTKNGGGTRQLVVKKTLSVSDVCAEALSTFFPNGISKFGSLSDFDCEIRDFKGDRFDNGKSIEQLYEESKLKMLRLYLYSTKKAHSTETGKEAEEIGELPFHAHSSDSSGDELLRGRSAAGAVPFNELPATTSSMDTTSTGIVTSAGSPSCSETTTALDSGTPEVTFHPRFTKNYPSTLAGQSAATSLQTEDVDIIDSEDEELQRALQASLLDMNPEMKASSSHVRRLDVLKELQVQAVHQVENPTKIIIQRSDVLQSALKALDKKSINFKARLNVKFSGEIGEDFDGPRREFFRLAIKAVHDSGFFEGPERGKVFTHDISMLERNQYQLLGRLVALSLAQEGSGLHFVNGHLYDLMVGRDVDLSSVELSLPDDLRKLIIQIEDVDTKDKWNKFLQGHAEELIDRGIGNPLIFPMDKKGEIVRMLKKHYLYYRISSEISQFKDGMNEVGRAWDFIKDHADQFKPLFCHSQRNLTAQEITSFFKINYSKHESNERGPEEVTVYSWELFVQSIEEGQVPVTFDELLAFTTGSDHIPPTGLTKPIDILFYDKESGKNTPFVSTSSLKLWLPRGENPESLSRLFLNAIKRI